MNALVYPKSDTESMSSFKHKKKNENILRNSFTLNQSSHNESKSNHLFNIESLKSQRNSKFKSLQSLYKLSSVFSSDSKNIRKINKRKRLSEHYKSIPSGSYYCDNGNENKIVRKEVVNIYKSMFPNLEKKIKQKLKESKLNQIDINNLSFRLLKNDGSNFWNDYIQSEEPNPKLIYNDINYKNNHEKFSDKFFCLKNFKLCEGKYKLNSKNKIKENMSKIFKIFLFNDENCCLEVKESNYIKCCGIKIK